MHWNAHMSAICMPHHVVAASDPFQCPAALAQRLDDVPFLRERRLGQAVLSAPFVNASDFAFGCVLPVRVCGDRVFN